jgi:hypothetical protein
MVLVKLCSSEIVRLRLREMFVLPVAYFAAGRGDLDAVNEPSNGS